MATMKHRTQAVLKLPQLQNLIKRDPEAYRPEFMMQKRHFESELEIFKLRPTKDHERFTELVTFVSHVSVCYKEECEKIPVALLELLETHANVLHPDVRAKLLQAAIMLRNKGMIDPLLLIKLAFKLLSVTDKTLRISLVEYVFNDIKTINQEKQNNKLNRSIQAFLFTVVEEDTTITGKKTVDILCELYRRKVWTDARTVNMIAAACLSNSARVSVTALNFFLGIETKMHDDEEEEKSTATTPTDVDYHSHSKKTKKRQRHVQKQVERVTKIRQAAASKGQVAQPLFPAIQMLHDPQSLAEKLFKKTRQTGERFEVKLLVMNFVSRLIGCHKLIMFSFYSFLQRYLTSHQQEVTRILAYLIQACHELVPPEDLLPVVKAIAYNFVTERCTNEVISVGINAIREIILRAPALLREEGMGDFVQDLAMYGRKTHKSVMIAAHGIVNLVRELYPALLRKSDRGKHHNPTAQPADYGQQYVANGVEGVELLEAYERGDIKMGDDDEIVWDGDEIEEEEDEEEGEEEDEGEDEEEVEGDDDDKWVDVSDDGEEEEEEMEVEAEPVTEENTVVSRAKQLTSIRGRLDARRVLTSEDFQLLAKLRASQAERAMDPRFRSKKALLITDSTQLLKRKREQADEDNAEEGAVVSEYAVDPLSLAPEARAEKTSKIDRIVNMLTGRKETRWEHEGHAGGLTNKEKLRKKNFVMVRKGKRAVAGKIRTSTSQQRTAKAKQGEQMGRDRRKRRRT